MPLYIVAYDLRGKKDYQKLWDEFSRLGAHKPVRSTYLLNVNLSTASGVRDHLEGFIDNDDHLIVVPFHKKPAFTKARSGTNKWIDENV